MAVIACCFVQGVHESDARELIESFPNAILLTFFEQKIHPTGVECSWARCQVSPEQEQEFIEYLRDDVMVSGAEKTIIL